MSYCYAPWRERIIVSEGLHERVGVLYMLHWSGQYYSLKL